MKTYLADLVQRNNLTVIYVLGLIRWFTIQILLLLKCVGLAYEP